jgi:predicted RNA-binding protein
MGLEFIAEDVAHDVVNLERKAQGGDQKAYDGLKAFVQDINTHQEGGLSYPSQKEIYGEIKKLDPNRQPNEVQLHTTKEGKSFLEVPPLNYGTAHKAPTPQRSAK